MTDKSSQQTLRKQAKVLPLVKALPREIDPRKLARNAVELSGQVDPKELVRLDDLLLKSTCPVKIELSFFIDEQNRFCINGKIFMDALLKCQRCLEASEHNLISEPNLGIVHSETEASQLPKHLDPWIVKEHTADLYSLIEEELILSMPIVPKHSFACLQASSFNFGLDEVEIEQGSNTLNASHQPFKALEQMFKKNQQDK